MFFLYSIGGIFFVFFMLIVFRGAPYVPTKRRDVEHIFSMHRFTKADLLVDLGSGDGRLLRAAAERSIRSVGYELNPVLVAISMLRLRKHSEFARVKIADFWLTSLPAETSVVFVFLATPYMKKLDNLLLRHVNKYQTKIILVSYGMEIPGKKPNKIDGSFLVYRYKA